MTKDDCESIGQNCEREGVGYLGDLIENCTQCSVGVDTTGCFIKFGMLWSL